jgi:hypothetical protein
MSIVFTFPGKLGDALLQWPVAYQFSKVTNQRFQVWMDEKTCKPLEPLFRAQPCVSDVKLVSGVENWNCGGQPFHMNLPTASFDGNTIYHLGLRRYPTRQITLETLEYSRLPVEIDKKALVEEPSIVPAREVEKRNRLIIHGQGVCPHTCTTPMMWKFLASVRGELEELFDEIMFVGSERDREVGSKTYPDWGQFDDEGNFSTLAVELAASRAVIACGSCVAVLAGCLHVPCIRVHDPVSETAPKVIWSNLAPNSINDTELELRDSWPKWRDQTLLNEAVATP